MAASFLLLSVHSVMLETPTLMNGFVLFSSPIKQIQNKLKMAKGNVYRHLLVIVNHTGVLIRKNSTKNSTDYSRSVEINWNDLSSQFTKFHLMKRQNLAKNTLHTTKITKINSLSRYFFYKRYKFFINTGLKNLNFQLTSKT